MAFNSEQIKILDRAQNDFTYFVEHIGSKSIPNFVMGEYVETACRFQSQHKKTIRLAFRSGMKSKIAHLFLMWKIMFQGINNNIDMHYYSYKEDLAGLHVREVKKMIADNPYFEELIDLKTRADSIGEFSWDRKHIISIRPRGIVSASRGIKGDLIIADDILSDPAQPIIPTLIFKINELFKSVILENIKPDGEIHVLGSPISRVDFYFDPELRHEFAFMGTPSIIDKGTPEARSAWPEFISLEELLAKERARGPRIFEREFQISPYYSEDSFFKKDYLRKNAVNQNLSNIDIKTGYVTDKKVIAGLDVGKKRHPSLLCYDSETEVLTDNGWKYFKNVQDNDKIATLNPKTQYMEYQKPSRFFEYDYDDKMYSIENKNVSLLVTPDHKMYFSKTRKWKRHRRGRDKIMLGAKKWKWGKKWEEFYKEPQSFELVRAEDINGRFGYYKRNAKWQGQEKESFIIPSIIRYKKLRSSKIKISKKLLEHLYCDQELSIVVIAKKLGFGSGIIFDRLKRFGITNKLSKKKRKDVYKVKYKNKIEARPYPSIKIPMDLWLEFLGYWIAKGSVVCDKTHNQIQVSQQYSSLNPYNIKSWPKMKICLERITKKLGVSLEKNKLGHFCFSCPQLAEYLKKLGSSKRYSKFIPKEFKQLSSRQLKILFNALMLGDGAKTGKNKGQFYSTASPKLADDFQEICLKTGLVATIIYRRVSIHRSNKQQNDGEPCVNYGIKQDKLVHYKGKVYDLEVPKHHIIYVRRNGRGVWSSNCVFLMTSGHAKMIHLKFMEGWPYFTGKDEFDPSHPSQLEYLKEAIKAFNIDELYYDATRGEFESAIDQGVMPPQMIPVVSTHRIKESTATAFDKAVLNKEIEIINDDRLLTSITQMTKELMAIEDKFGNHGEGFTSIALCFQGINKLIMSGSQTNEVTVGQKSIFDDDSGKVPEGF